MNSSITKKQLRRFSFVIGFAFPIFIGLIIPVTNGYPFRIWILLVGISILIIGLIKPYFLTYPYKYLIIVGNYLVWNISRIILGLVFIFVIQPIALMMKLFNYDPLRGKKNNNKSYREKIENKKIDLTRMY